MKLGILYQALKYLTPTTGRGAGGPSRPAAPVAGDDVEEPHLGEEEALDAEFRASGHHPKELLPVLSCASVVDEGRGLAVPDDEHIDNPKIFFNTKNLYPELFRAPHALPPGGDDGVPAVDTDVYSYKNLQKPENPAPGDKPCLDLKKNPQWIKLIIAEGFTRINPTKGKQGGFEWACVSFSCMGYQGLTRFSCNLRRKCRAIGMDSVPEPTMLIHSEADCLSDVENTLHGTFTKIEMEDTKSGILILFFPCDGMEVMFCVRRASDFLGDSADGPMYDIAGNFDGVCEHVEGVLHKCCFPWSSSQDMKKMSLPMKKIASVIRVASNAGTEEYDIYDEETGQDEWSDSGSDELTSESYGSEHIGLPTLEDDDESEDDDRSDDDDGSEDDDGPEEIVLIGDMVESEIKVGGTVKSWAIVNFSLMSDDATLRLTDKLRSVCMDIGMNFYPMALRYLKKTPARPSDIEDALWGIQDEIAKVYSKPGVKGCLSLLIVVMPDQEECVKVEEVCESLDIVYQCIKPCAKDSTVVRKKHLECAAKEIKTKVLDHEEKGVPGPLKHTAIPFVSEAPTMICGADIFHSKGADGSTSVASLVASIDWPGANKYKSVVSCQPSDEFLIKDLFSPKKKNCGMFSELLGAFLQNRKRLPERIIFFRNAVMKNLTDCTFRDNEMKNLMDVTYLHEVDAINKACAHFKEGYCPKVTFVFVAEVPSLDESGVPADFNFGEDNCNPEIILYLKHPLAPCSLGSRTICYSVPYDDNKFTVDDLQSLCIGICTPWMRWAYPEAYMVPPAYLAYLVASKAQEYFDNTASTSTGSNGASTCQMPKMLLY
ncbi:hypothetical protein EJB05_21953, partial [Eragrostis curvula]